MDRFFQETPDAFHRSAALAALGKHDDALNALLQMESITDEQGGYVDVPYPMFYETVTAPKMAVPNVTPDLINSIYQVLAKEAEEYLSLFPDDQEILCYLTEACHRLGNKGALVLVSLKAIAIDPKSDWSVLVREFLGEVSPEYILAAVLSQFRPTKSD